MEHAVEVFRQCSNCIVACAEKLAAFASMYQQRQSLFEAILMSSSVAACATGASHDKPLRLCVEPLGVLSMNFGGLHVPQLLLAQYDKDLTALLVSLNESRASLSSMFQKLQGIADRPLSYGSYSSADCREALGSMVRCVHGAMHVVQRTVSALRSDAAPCSWDGPEPSCQKLRDLLLASAAESPCDLVGALPKHLKNAWSELCLSLDPVAAVLLLQ